MTTLDLESLSREAGAFGLFLSEKQLEDFDNYAAALIDGNKGVNLVGTSDPGILLSHHMLDSLSCLAGAELTDGARVIDIGSGAGLPGLPVAIARPGLDVTLLDSSERRTAFLRRVITSLGLRNVMVFCGRAETAGREPEYRDAYGAAVARAVAPLPVLIEYALPFIKEGGVFIAQRGTQAKTETAGSTPALKELNGVLREIKKLETPFLENDRYLVIIEKTGPTPERYPRRCGVPLKRPLGGS